MATVAEFLIERLESTNVKHVFRVPGINISDLFAKLNENNKIKVVNTTDESHAGFAADAYARVHGIGVVCVTYNTGALKLINAIAGAYLERSPIIVISGAPSTKERAGFLNCQKEIFEKITCASVILDNPLTAGYEIDKAFEALKHNKQPVYIELPKDIAKKSIRYDVYNFGTPEPPQSQPEILEEALEEVIGWITKADNPVILAGVELDRYDLGSELLRFSEKHNIPIATTLLSKSVIDEEHENFIGVYCGSGNGGCHVCRRVNESDCLLALGVMVPDLMKMNLEDHRKNMVLANVKNLDMRGHSYQNVQFVDFCHKLFATNIERQKVAWSVKTVKPDRCFNPKPNTSITLKRLYDKINAILNRSMMVVVDPGEALLISGELTVHRKQFLCPAFYLSTGFAIPAALGIQLAIPELRPVVVVGHHAFQMSLCELSTIVNLQLNPIVIVLNSEHTTMMKDHNVVQLIGGGNGVKVTNEEELEKCVRNAVDSNDLFVLNVMLDKEDVLTRKNSTKD